MKMKTLTVAFAIAAASALPAFAAGGDCAGKTAPQQQSSISAPTTSGAQSVSVPG